MEIPSDLLYTLEIVSRILPIILGAILGWERQVRRFRLFWEQSWDGNAKSGENQLV